MHTTTSLTFGLRAAAVTALLIALGVWFSTGAHTGWTQTSAVTMQRDDITGIDYPVRRNVFVAGIEVPLLGTAAATAFAGLSLLTQRRRAAAV
ncbi:MAG TPA: hypothetical protein VGD81_12950 [Opitutaceae bacterium]